jgi:hypothetical protein
MSSRRPETSSFKRAGRGHCPAWSASVRTPVASEPGKAVVAGAVGLSAQVVGID